MTGNVSTFAAGLILLGMAMPVPALAATDAEVMPVSAEVINGCTITASPMNFGSLFGVSGPVRTTASIQLRCTPNTAYGVEMDYGLNRQGQNRRMFNPVGNRYLRYRVYSEASYTQQWDERPRRQMSGNTGASGIVILTAYGEIPALTNLATAGTYSDTVVVTVEF